MAALQSLSVTPILIHSGNTFSFQFIVLDVESVMMLSTTANISSQVGVGAVVGAGVAPGVEAGIGAGVGAVVNLTRR